MTSTEERFLIYAALLMVCAAAGLLLGPAAALWSFVQIAFVIELLFLFGAPARARRLRNWHR